MTWLTDTFLATGALIALILVLRRPVSRMFGPGLAYALWALPLLRLILPPLLLPAEAEPASIRSSSTADTDMILVQVENVPDAAGWNILVWAQVVWLAGAVAYLGWRFWQYRAMRQRLLEGGREVGRSGVVRLIEGPAISSPVAFGLFDKVVALPLGFVDREDRAGRDLAIAHELEHHAGRDLAVNMAVQPLLALHWFNPLAWLGWRALRRDQEAACDARVLKGRGRATREAYGRLIASLARGPQPALASPLACPVIGEKSIIYRLRSLTMNEPSFRRRIAGRALIGAAALALPLTATISYAAGEASPSAPEAPKVEKKIHKITIVDKAGGADPSDPSLKTRIIERDGKTIVIKSDKELSEAEAEAKAAEAEASLAEAEAQMMMVEAKAEAHESAKSDRKRKIMMVRKGGDDADIDIETLDGEGVAIACAGDLQSIEADNKNDGKTEKVEMRWCSRAEAKAEARKHALAAMKQARDQMRQNEELSEKIRKEVLEKLDAKIAELSKQG